jgi:hypothetical protein
MSSFFGTVYAGGMALTPVLEAKMARNEPNPRLFRRDFNRLTVKAPYQRKLEKLTAFLTIKGIARMTGIEYMTLRRMCHPGRHRYCRVKNAALVTALYDEFAELCRAMERKRRLYDQF